jgi:hypothetical protein
MDEPVNPIRAASVMTLTRYNPLTATIYTAKGCLEAADTLFVNCCCLAAHHSTRYQLVTLATGQPLLSDSTIFVREPCRLFWTEILKPLVSTATSTAFLAPFHSFLEHLLRQARIDLQSICNPTFFTGELLHALFSVNAWMVAPNLQPLLTPPRSFHVYRLISSLRNHTTSALQLPVEGLSLMDAKHIGVLAYYLFAMLNLTDTFEDTKFRCSLFGQRLKAWSDLPDNPLVHGISRKWFS